MFHEPPACIDGTPVRQGSWNDCTEIQIGFVARAVAALARSRPAWLALHSKRWHRYVSRSSAAPDRADTSAIIRDTHETSGLEHDAPNRTRVRSIFISDIHLGTRGCQAERLLDFLRDFESDKLFLIGDIVDFWAMSRGIHWTPAQNTVVQKILRRARHGQQVMLIPGNHDEAIREYDGVFFGDILVKLEHIHTAADGKRYLLVHGDEFDQVTRYHRWLALLGDVGYNLLVRLNAWLSRLRRLLRRPGYWSLAGYAKNKVKKAVNFVFDFEDSVIHAVRERGLDGVICGHIHSATIRNIDGIVYVNCGDWVDSCTGIVEHLDGRLELIGSRRGMPVLVTAIPAASNSTRPDGTTQPAPAIARASVSGIPTVNG